MRRSEAWNAEQVEKHMELSNERKLAARAKSLGESADAKSFAELEQLTRSSSALVRRLAASAIGKLAGIVPAEKAVQCLQKLLVDEHPQVRQYSAKALGAFGVDARVALPDLRTLYTHPHEKAYVKRSVRAAGVTITEAIRIAENKAVHHCQRCGVQVAADEYARAQKTFQRIYCDRCFDEVFLERRNFETQVELNKTIEARDGTVVQSEGERRIAEWLTAHGLAYRYDAKYRIIGEFQIRPDFYLPELDVYIEYWGLDTPHYKMSMYKKQTLYQQEGKRLISIYPTDLPRLGALMTKKLALFGYMPTPRTPSTPN